MAEIEAWIKDAMKKVNSNIPGGLPMKRLLVFVASIVGAVVTYKWLKENLAKLLEG